MSVCISMEKSQGFKFHYFFLLILKNWQCHKIWVGTAHRNNVPDWTTKQKPPVGQVWYRCEVEDTAVSPLKKTSKFVLTGEKHIFQPSMKQSGDTMFTAIIFKSILITSGVFLFTQGATVYNLHNVYYYPYKFIILWGEGMLLKNI